jgi:Ulp1 family protease
MAYECPLFAQILGCLEELENEEPFFSFHQLTPSKISFLGRQFVSRFPIVSIDEEDLNCLYGREWINDQVLNGYLALLASQCEPRIGYTNSFFFKKLERDGPEAASCWHGIKGKLISPRYDHFIIPICFGHHWISAVFNFVDGQLWILDSFHGEFRDVAKLLNGFLEFLGETPLSEIYPNVPRQTNGWDCGVFVMQFARCIFRGVPWDSFSQAEMPRIRTEILKELKEAMNKSA